jgi:hypothetical protein
MPKPSPKYGPAFQVFLHLEQVAMSSPSSGNAIGFSQAGQGKCSGGISIEAMLAPPACSPPHLLQLFGNRPELHQRPSEHILLGIRVRRDRGERLAIRRRIGMRTAASKRTC